MERLATVKRLISWVRINPEGDETVYWVDYETFVNETPDIKHSGLFKIGCTVTTELDMERLCRLS